ncbi:MAG TPA: NADH-quinone oxidoreductase subunit L [Thermomicrobiaceae bacterium]|nr:NADH-quinone oxidoreductase subunit L [Thermomicrobiaceae bacterium]
MANWLFLIPLAPLVAAVVNFVFGRWYIRDRAHWISITAVGISFVVSVIVFAQIYGGTVPLSQHLYTWIPVGDFQIPVTLTVDQLTAIMLLVVSGVSLLVHIYSVGYMRGDGGYYRFFSYLPLFVFSMLMLVLASNYLLLFVFWEGVGLCSYLLIGFWFRRLSAANAAKKAFIVNRVGDLGFGIGIMFIFVKVGSLDYTRVFAAVPHLPSGSITLIALLLFTGAIGKSAQIPLFVWLPDAMEGPTPVSALIHAATMVTAGIFMVARSFPIFSASHTAMLVVAIIGAITAFVAATIGLTQYDIKKVIAYSTVSQLGYMAFALGVGAWTAAIFHLMTHAFFKGLLFLGAGSVIHGMHDEQDMRFMGGLKKYMPITFWTFLIGAAANAGLFPFAGFWSKDETILGAWAGGFPIIAIVGLIAAFFTSLYMFRVVFLTFLGEERFDHAHVHPHESPSTMTVPLVVLAIGAGLAGFLGFPDHSWIASFLGPVFTHNGVVAEPHPSVSTTVIFAVVSTIIAVSGILLTWRAYVSRKIVPAAISARLGPLYQLSFRKWYFDEIYERLIVHPLYLASVFLWRVVDVRVIDATVNGVAGVVSFTSERWRRAQTGLVANYALAIALGAVIIVGVYLIVDSSLIR